MTKEEIASVLEEIATFLELKGENAFKIRAYTNASRSLEQWGGSFADLGDLETLEKIPGVGKAIAAKIKELATTGGLKFRDDLRAEFPADILELFKLQGLGAKKVRALYEQLAVSSIAQLKESCESGRVATLPGFGATTQAKLLESIGALSKHVGSFQLGAVIGDAEKLKADLSAHPNALQVEIAGSYRRWKEIVRDIDFIVATSLPDAITTLFVEHALVDSVIARGKTKSSVRLKSGIQADLRVVSTSEFPFALSYFTGSKEHNITMRNRALQRGWTLNEYRLGPAPEAKRKAPVPEISDEAELYRTMGLDYIAPELRENFGEFEAAENNKLPKLIELENLRGTFHCHTHASDGRNSLEEIAKTAQELGLEYLGIADHSRSSVQAHGLSIVDLNKQIASIEKLNARFDGFRLFAGIECDILRDGTLDFPDDVLAQLDYVVASVHSAFGLSEAQMTERVIRAISNPYVTMLAHPTGRILLRRDEYAIDLPEVIDAAAATGTWIEINSAPKRLDLDWRWWPLAKSKGVKCVINPDAHRVERIQDIRFGIGVARKGWLTKRDVMNCLPLGKIEPELQRKRAKRSRVAAKTS